MRILFLLITIFLFLFLQVVALSKLSIGEISPDFMLLLCAFIALYKGAVRGSLIGFLIGFLQDLFNPTLLGLNALMKSLIGFGFGHIGAKADPDRAVLLLVVFFLAAMGHDIVYLLFDTALDLGNLVAMFFSVALPSAVYTAVVGVVLHRLLLIANSRMVKSFGKER